MNHLPLGLIVLWTLAVGLGSAEAAKPRRDVRLLPSRRNPADVQAPLPVRLPAEFETQAALILGGGELAQFFPDLFVQVAQATLGQIPLVVMVSSDAERALLTTAMVRQGYPVESIQFASVPHDTMWARDYGPTVVERANGSKALIDAEYFEGERKDDDRVPGEIGKLAALPVFQAPARIEGGNLLSNGHGVALTTFTTLDRNIDRRIDEFALKRLLHNYYGVRQAVVLEPLWGEATGHVDMFSTFVTPQTVVVGRYDAHDDPRNAALLDRNAQRLATIRTTWGPMRVVRMPMPPNHDGIWRSYTNAVFCNRTVLVPVYPTVCPELDRQALDIYRQELPGWTVAPIDVTQLIERGGALHCVSLNLPHAGRMLEALRRREQDVLPQAPEPLPIALPADRRHGEFRGVEPVVYESDAVSPLQFPGETYPVETLPPPFARAIPSR